MNHVYILLEAVRCLWRSPAKPTVDLVPGLQVILRHLKQAAELNGSRGILERFDLASNRWEVRCPHVFKWIFHDFGWKFG